MLQLMQKMELLLGKTPPDDVRSDVLPLLYRALECDTQQIQELCLSVIPSCAQLVEHHAMKNALLPKIKKLCLGTGYLSVCYYYFFLLSLKELLLVVSHYLNTNLLISTAYITGGTNIH